jgi:cell wall-associated NlpC family hydrolase
MQARVAIALLKNRQVQTVLLVGVLLIVMLPVLVAAGVAGLFSEEAESACGGAGVGAINQPAGGGPLAQGLYAAPLELAPGRWYEVGATAYGGPGDGTSDFGSIPEPGESYLPSHPDSFAELSVLDSNPADGGGFTFADANALGNLPYLAGLRVAHDGRERLLLKRDVGYGQGPGQFIANGQPYRLDVWWQAAQHLGVSKSAVRVQLAPGTGAASTLGALPSSSEASGSGEAGAACEAVEGAGSVPLPLTPGAQTKILRSGLAAAGEEAPPAVRRMVAAANRLFGAAYLWGGGHGTSLNTLQPGYDCSSAVSYVLHAGGAFGDYAEDSTELESYGAPGPGRYVSIYANAAHAFVYVGGLRFDTVYDRAYDTGPNSEKSGPKWRVSGSVPGWSTWVVRHPPGL